jgi:hypothetical protein
MSGCVKRGKEALIEQQLWRAHSGINKFLADVMQDQSGEPKHEGCEQLRRVVSQTGSCVNRCSEPSSLANVPDVPENVPQRFALYS